MEKSILCALVMSTFMIMPAAYAGKMELTTYYPAPNGEYKTLTADSVQLNAKTGDPSTWSAGTTGQVVYSDTKDLLYHYNGSVWVASGGGGGGCYVDYSLPVGSAVGSACSVSGFTIKIIMDDRLP